jgi:3-hydroxybutyryl-CoA dehydratase
MADAAPSYDDLREGDQFPVSTFEVSEEIVRLYRDAADDHYVVHPTSCASPELEPGISTAPPTLAALWTLPGAYCTALTLPVGTIHARQSYRFLRTVVPGNVLYTRLQVAHKYVKRGRKYLVLGTVSTDAHGEVVVEGRATLIWP